MSNVYCIIQAIKNDPLITIDGIADATGLDGKQIRQALYKTKADGRIRTGIDPVTNAPCYEITTKGDAWLLNHEPASDHHDAQPEAAKNTGSQRAGRPTAPFPPAALAAEQPAPVEAVGNSLAGADSVMRYFPLYVGPGFGFDTPEQAAEVARGMERLADMAICEVRPVARIKLQPVLVPIA